MDNGEGYDLVYSDYSDYASDHSSGVCGQLGCVLMYDFHYQLKEYYKVVGKRLLEIVKKVYLETDKEEIEFNGRWADDGGRNVE